MKSSTLVIGKRNAYSVFSPLLLGSPSPPVLLLHLTGPLLSLLHPITPHFLTATFNAIFLFLLLLPLHLFITQAATTATTQEVFPFLGSWLVHRNLHPLQYLHAFLLSSSSYSSPLYMISPILGHALWCCPWPISLISSLLAKRTLALLSLFWSYLVFLMSCHFASAQSVSFAVTVVCLVCCSLFHFPLAEVQVG